MNLHIECHTHLKLSPIFFKLVFIPTPPPDDVQYACRWHEDWNRTKTKKKKEDDEE